MSACKNCFDTGHSNGGLSPYLDCTQCEVATLRAKLNDQFPLASKMYPDSLWGAYQAGQKPLLERIQELEREVAANRQKIAAGSIPAGWKLVPIEPTPDMCRALFLNLIYADEESRVIKAVMAAAPSPADNGGGNGN